MQSRDIYGDTRGRLTDARTASPAYCSFAASRATTRAPPDQRVPHAPGAPNGPLSPGRKGARSGRQAGDVEARARGWKGRMPREGAAARPHDRATASQLDGERRSEQEPTHDERPEPRPEPQHHDSRDRLRHVSPRRRRLDRQHRERARDRLPHARHGAALRQRGRGGGGIRRSPVPREEIVVTTKVPGRFHGRAEARESFEALRAALGLDAIDLLLIQWPLPRLGKYVDTWRTLIDLQEEGLVRSIGVSNFTPDHIRRLQDETGLAPAVN